MLEGDTRDSLFPPYFWHAQPVLLPCASLVLPSDLAADPISQELAPLVLLSNWQPVAAVWLAPDLNSSCIMKLLVYAEINREGVCKEWKREDNSQSHKSSQSQLTVTVGAGQSRLPKPTGYLNQIRRFDHFSHVQMLTKSSGDQIKEGIVNQKVGSDDDMSYARSQWHSVAHYCQTKSKTG